MFFLIFFLIHYINYAVKIIFLSKKSDIFFAFKTLTYKFVWTLGFIAG